MVTQEDIENEKNIQEIRALKRAGHINAIKDWSVLMTGLIAGFGIICVGLLEYFIPELLTPEIKNPLLVSLVGISLLGRPKFAELLKKISKISG